MDELFAQDPFLREVLLFFFFWSSANFDNVFVSYFLWKFSSMNDLVIFFFRQIVDCKFYVQVFKNYLKLLLKHCRFFV